MVEIDQIILINVVITECILYDIESLMFDLDKSVFHNEEKSIATW